MSSIFIDGLWLHQSAVWKFMDEEQARRGVHWHVFSRGSIIFCKEGIPEMSSDVQVMVRFCGFDA